MANAEAANRFVVEMGEGHSVGFAELRQAMAFARFAERRKLHCRIWLIEADGPTDGRFMHLLAETASDPKRAAPERPPIEASVLWASGALHEKS